MLIIYWECHIYSQCSQRNLGNSDIVLLWNAKSVNQGFVSFSHHWVILKHMTGQLNSVFWWASQCFELLSGLNGFLAEIFDDLMNDVLILQLRLIASETFISSLEGRCSSVELLNSAIRKCIIALRITTISSCKDSLYKESGYT